MRPLSSRLINRLSPLGAINSRFAAEDFFAVAMGVFGCVVDPWQTLCRPRREGRFAVNVVAGLRRDALLLRNRLACSLPKSLHDVLGSTVNSVVSLN